MAGFWHEAWFFTGELFKFMSLFYIVWVPGFLLAGLRARRFCYQAWNSVLANPGPGLAGIIRAVAAGVVGSVGGKESIGATDDFLIRNVSPTLDFAFLIASRNMTVHFWAIFALLLGALVMIGIVTVSLHGLKLKALEAPSKEKSQGVESVKHPGSVSWRAVLLSTDGCLAIIKFIGQEIRRFAPSLAVGIALGGGYPGSRPARLVGSVCGCFLDMPRSPRIRSMPSSVLCWA